MVAFDLLGPPPRANQGNAYVLLVVDRPVDTLKDTLYRLTRERHKVAQPSWYMATSRDGVALTLSLATEV